MIPAGVHARGACSSGYQMSHVDGVKSIRVFVRRNRLQHPPGVDMPGQRHLHQNRVDIGPVVQAGDDRQHLFRGGGHRRGQFFAIDPQFAARPYLVANILLGAGIVAHQDHRQTRRTS